MLDEYKRNPLSSIVQTNSMRLWWKRFRKIENKNETNRHHKDRFNGSIKWDTVACIIGHISSSSAFFMRMRVCVRVIEVRVFSHKYVMDTERVWEDACDFNKCKISQTYLLEDFYTDLSLHSPFLCASVDLHLVCVHGGQLRGKKKLSSFPSKSKSERDSSDKDGTKSLFSLGQPYR